MELDVAVYQSCTAVSPLIVRNSRVYEQRICSDGWCIVNEGVAKTKRGELDQMSAIFL